MCNGCYTRRFNHFCGLARSEGHAWCRRAGRREMTEPGPDQAATGDSGQRPCGPGSAPLRGAQRPSRCEGPCGDPRTAWRVWAPVETRGRLCTRGAAGAAEAGAALPGRRDVPADWRRMSPVPAALQPRRRGPGCVCAQRAHLLPQWDLVTPGGPENQQVGRGARPVPWQPGRLPKTVGPPGLQPVQSRPDSAPLSHWHLPTGPCDGCFPHSAPGGRGSPGPVSSVPHTQQTFHKPVLISQTLA